MAKQVSDLIVERLIEWGVDTIFGYPGDGVDGFFESLRTHKDKLKFIQVRHEEAAAFAACGYAKYTGRLGVCCATSGPGGVHLLNGPYDAKCDLQPVLAITGHTFSDLIGMDYQQDVDLDKLYMDVAEFNERVMNAPHAVNCVDMAVRTAYGRRGVSHIRIPKDIQEWKVSDDHRSDANVKHHSGDYKVFSLAIPSRALMQQAADVINAGSKVVVLAGRGALGCSEELVELAETVGGAVVKALLGKAVLPDRSPYTTSGLGLLGTAPSVDAMQECDTLIMIGTSYPYLDFLPKPGQANAGRSRSTLPASGCATRLTWACSATRRPAHISDRQVRSHPRHSQPLRMRRQPVSHAGFSQPRPYHPGTGRTHRRLPHQPGQPHLHLERARHDPAAPPPRTRPAGNLGQGRPPSQIKSLRSPKKTHTRNSLRATHRSLFISGLNA